MNEPVLRILLIESDQAAAERLRTDLVRSRSARFSVEVVRTLAEALRQLLVDRYDDDWSQLWWARADGRAEVVTAGKAWERAVALLAAKYAAYRAVRPQGAAIVVHVERWATWSP